jgi:hypothetical protein
MKGLSLARLACAALFCVACQRTREPQAAPDSQTAAPRTEPSPSQPIATAAPPAGARTFAFDGDAVDSPPAGFVFGRTGQGRPGRWVIRADSTAPSAPNVLAQLDTDDTDYRFPVAVTSEAMPRDVRVSVRCKPVAGKVDRACGIVLRYRDENNYYVTRANALEANIRLYFVRDGQRRQIASHNGAVTSDTWHDYRIEARGDHFEVHWDGQRVIDHHDSTFTEGGRVGVWTKADSVTYFDDLRVEPLAP